MPDRSSNPNHCSPPTRAVVLGASIAGPLDARVLSDHHSEVLLERDESPTAAVPHKGTLRRRWMACAPMRDRSAARS